MFTNAIVRTPCKKMVKGITTANEGLPDYQTALIQHKIYTDALKSCGLEITTLPPIDKYPDSTFVEDAALLTPVCGIVMRPGVQSRRKETQSIKRVISDFYEDIEEIKVPGTVEGGDVMMVDSHYFIGLSDRTNQEGAEQLINLLNKYGLTASTIKLKKGLHLKSEAAYLGHNNLVVSIQFYEEPDFKKFNLLKITEKERYAANCVWINNRVLVPKGYPESKETIVNAGYEVIEFDMSEFKKLDGGISCLSLRF